MCEEGMAAARPPGAPMGNTKKEFPIGQATGIWDRWGGVCAARHGSGERETDGTGHAGGHDAGGYTVITQEGGGAG